MITTKGKKGGEIKLGTRPTSPSLPTSPTGGFTFLGNDKGPKKRIEDNIIEKTNRQIDYKFKSANGLSKTKIGNGLNMNNLFSNIFGNNNE